MTADGPQGKLDAALPAYVSIATGYGPTFGVDISLDNSQLVLNAEGTYSLLSDTWLNRLGRSLPVAGIRIATAVSATNSSLREIRLQAWRETANGSGQFDLVSQSENFAASLQRDSADVTTCFFAEALTNCQLGDFMGLQATTTNTAGISLAYQSNTVGSDIYVLTNAPTDSAGFRMTGSKTANARLDFQVIQPAPMVYCVGDSLVMGDGGTHGTPGQGTENLSTAMLANSSMLGGYGSFVGLNWNPPHSFPYWLTALLRYECQNGGVGGTVMSQILTLFEQCAVPSDAVVYVVNGGINDMNSGLPESEYLAGWKGIFTAIPPGRALVCLGLFPYTTASDEFMQRRDTWKADLRLLAAQFTNVVYVDLDPVLGQYRPGGPADNHWDIQPLYRSEMGDGLHFNQTGYMAMATNLAPIADGLMKKYYTTAFLAPRFLGLDRDASGKLEFHLETRSPVPVVVESSDDLATWKEAVTVPAGMQDQIWTEPDGGTNQTRFFRAWR